MRDDIFILSCLQERYYNIEFQLSAQITTVQAIKARLHILETELKLHQLNNNEWSSSIYKKYVNEEKILLEKELNKTIKINYINNYPDRLIKFSVYLEPIDCYSPVDYWYQLERFPELDNAVDTYYQLWIPTYHWNETLLQISRFRFGTIRKRPLIGYGFGWDWATVTLEL